VGSSEFSWSVSRHDAFARCRRRYFYSYYAANEDPEIQRLKKLSALPMWAGSVVHETIEAVLKTRDALPSPDEQEALIRAAVHGQMLTDWRESEAGSLRFRLFEHEYQVAVEPDDKKILVGTVMRSLRNFFKSPILGEAFAAGRVVIVDWKTGRGEGKFSEVQVAGYALYAAEQGWAAPEEIQTELAYLAIPRYVRRSIDRRKLDHLRSFVAKSAKNMRALLLDPLANLARREDFPMIDRPQACRRCNFRRLCFPRADEAAVAAASAPLPA